VNLWATLGSRAPRADGGGNEAESEVPVGTEPGMVDVSEDDHSETTSTRVRRSMRRKGVECAALRGSMPPAMLQRCSAGVLTVTSDGSEYDQTDRDEEPKSDLGDTLPDDESESDSDEPPAMRVAREYWGTPSRDYPERL
jgi:hypothetical protein